MTLQLHNFCVHGWRFLKAGLQSELIERLKYMPHDWVKHITRHVEMHSVWELYSVDESYRASIV